MLTVQKKTFSLAGMSPKSSNMTAKSGINTADTSKVYHLLVVGADALTMSEITVDGVSVEKVSGCAREFLVVDHLFCSCSDSTKTFVHVRDVNEMSAMYCASGASNSEFSESIKKSLPLCGNTVYGYSAPAKSGAGIGVPITCIVPTRTKRVFLSAKFLRTQIMVGWMRLPKGRPVSIQAGYANLVQLTTSLRLASLGGEFKIHCIEAAIMATTPTQKPQFIWIIAAVRRDMPTITAKIHHIAAETEQEARRILARDHVCFFAGRIRTGGAHA